MKIKEVFDVNMRRTVNESALHELFITHQLPKGLNVDEAVVLGKTETNQQANNFNSTEVNRAE